MIFADAAPKSLKPKLDTKQSLAMSSVSSSKVSEVVSISLLEGWAGADAVDVGPDDWITLHVGITCGMIFLRFVSELL